MLLLRIVELSGSLCYQHRKAFGVLMLMALLFSTVDFVRRADGLSLHKDLILARWDDSDVLIGPPHPDTFTTRLSLVDSSVDAPNTSAAFHKSASHLPVAFASYPVFPPPAVVEVEDAAIEKVNEAIEEAAIDYSDPVGGGRVPLVQINNRLNERVSRGFRVRDFASRDGADYARISDKLVKLLEQMRVKSGAIAIISGYRHRAYNDQVEGGAKSSQHIAGRAADIWSGQKTPLELALLAVELGGCQVGLGLGPNTLHVDVRGRLSSWTYPGAALSEEDFDKLIQKECGIIPEDEETPLVAEIDSVAQKLTGGKTVAVDSLLPGLAPVTPLESNHTDSTYVSTIEKIEPAFLPESSPILK